MAYASFGFCVTRRLVRSALAVPMKSASTDSRFSLPEMTTSVVEMLLKALAGMAVRSGESRTSIEPRMPP